MGQWPDPTPEPQQVLRPMLLAALVATAIGVAVWALGDGAGSSPLQKLRLPDMAWPDISAPDPIQDASTPAPTVEETTIPSILPEPDANGRIVQSVPFENCVSVIRGSTNAFGEPVLLETSPERRVAQFKLEGSVMIVTCSRREGTMTIEHR